jgi:hypothetical protein
MSLLKNKIVILLTMIILFVGIGLVVPSKAQPEANVKAIVKTTTTIIESKKLDDIKKLEHALNVQKLNKAIWINKTNEKNFYNKLAEIEAARIAEEQRIARQKAIEEQQAQQQQVPVANTPGNGRCGGNLPPCCVMERESGGSITAQNPTSSASGKWQFINSTWGNYMGYPTAASAPEWVQDQRAAELWAGGAGAGHWGGGC